MIDDVKSDIVEYATGFFTTNKLPSLITVVMESDGEDDIFKRVDSEVAVALTKIAVRRVFEYLENNGYKVVKDE